MRKVMCDDSTRKCHNFCTALKLTEERIRKASADVTEEFLREKEAAAARAAPAPAPAPNPAFSAEPAAETLADCSGSGAGSDSPSIMDSSNIGSSGEEGSSKQQVQRQWAPRER